MVTRIGEVVVAGDFVGLRRWGGCGERSLVLSILSLNASLGCLLFVVTNRREALGACCIGEASWVALGWNAGGK